jgi:hypothetical protein
MPHTKRKSKAGRPKGSPNKRNLQKEQEIVWLLDSIVDWKAFYMRVYRDALLGDSRSQKLLDERRWGKPMQSVHVETPDGKPFPIALIPA